MIVLTSVGAKTGKLSKTALMRVEHDGAYAVVASLGGAPRHPVWYFNLKANPHVELQDGPTKRDYIAREVTGDEKAVWWARAVETWPDYAGYQTRTKRLIPVFVLEPLDGALVSCRRTARLRPAPHAPRPCRASRRSASTWPTTCWPLWHAVQLETNDPDAALPYWAFAWAGGLAIGRYLREHPETVAGRRVFDLASGSGLCAIAALRAGALGT